MFSDARARHYPAGFCGCDQFCSHCRRHFALVNEFFGLKMTGRNRMGIVRKTCQVAAKFCPECGKRLTQCPY